MHILSVRVTMVKYILGIDIGTTSVKVCIVNKETHDVEAQNIKDTQSNIPSDTGPGGNKQDVSKIVYAINLCVSKLPKHLLQEVCEIGICGQMHGVLFWKNDSEKRAWEIIEKDTSVRYDVSLDRVSALYTWQDNRCDPSFLSTLPVPESHLNVSTGFGVATIFWMTKNKPEKLRRFNHSGTIADFAVAMLCNLDRPVMSCQNAASWGYFNCRTSEWNIDILKNANFPVELLPEVKASGKIAGYLAGNWHSVPKGTPVGVGLGDLQCSVLSTLETLEDAVLNISTSAQISFVVDSYVPNNGPPEVLPLYYWPYFGQQYVAVAASLNGGNSLATFVKMLQQWVMELGFNVPQSKVWEKLLAISIEDSAVSDLEIRPTCLGERYNPDLAASVSNIHVGNLGLAQVFRALCRGLMENLHSMIPREVLQSAKITRIVGNGSGLSRNKILQKEVEKLYQLPLVFTKGGDAAKGAALAVHLHSNT
ncbi:sedoheptulokinase-like isoform X2 [Diorhabda carinulata]|uniref:sedoheptulokinase-like isoform X2 n=1 Tax=Diorhabda carinulata TaxID=1163345 RepID=UPI0025A13F5C|nr:sedoheptulokinase-like isoform X2 [Diorhabda carinulata]